MNRVASALGYRGAGDSYRSDQASKRRSGRTRRKRRPGRARSAPSRTSAETVEAELLCLLRGRLLRPALADRFDPSSVGVGVAGSASVTLRFRYRGGIFSAYSSSVRRSTWTMQATRKTPRSFGPASRLTPFRLLPAICGYSLFESVRRIGETAMDLPPPRFWRVGRIPDHSALSSTRPIEQCRLRSRARDVSRTPVGGSGGPRTVGGSGGPKTIGGSGGPRTVGETPPVDYA